MKNCLGCCDGNDIPSWAWCRACGYNKAKILKSLRLHLERLIARQDCPEAIKEVIEQIAEIE